MALPTKLARVLASDPFEGFGRDIDSMFSRLLSRDPSSFIGGYAVDIWETADALHVEAELPGFDREQIDVTLENSVLTLTAERKADSEAQSREWLLNERRAMRFQRSFTLPPTVDENNVQARYENGVLHVTISKREESKPRKITVS